jgi:hypothetical protein
MAAVIFSGIKVKSLKKILNLFGGAEIHSSSTNPTSVAVSAPIGSLLLNESTGAIYKKLDSGLSTNWAELAVGAAQLTIVGTKAAPKSITSAGFSVALGNLSSSTAPLQKIYIQGSGGSVDITANPQVEAGAVDGQQIQFVGCSDDNSVLFEDGDGLSLNGNAEITDDRILTVSWDGINWVEVSRNF